MKEITSDQLRRHTGAVLMDAIKGNAAYVTRNGTRVAVLLPVDQFESLASVSVADLAMYLNCKVADVSTVITRLVDENSGPDGILHAKGTTTRNTLITAEGAKQISAEIATTGFPA